MTHHLSSLQNNHTIKLSWWSSYYNMSNMWAHQSIQNSHVSKLSWLNSCVKQLDLKTADQVQQLLQFQNSHISKLRWQSSYYNMCNMWAHRSIQNSHVSKLSWLNSCAEQHHFKTADQVRQFFQVHHFYTCLNKQANVNDSYSLSLLIIVLIAVW